MVTERGWIRAAFLCLSIAVAAPAGAELTDCRAIVSVPATITNRGVYCFDHNLATAAATGAAITIDADDVVLDLNGHKLDGSGAGPATAALGIKSFGHSHITIRNGTIRGFFAAIELDEAVAGSSSGHLVEDVKADRNTAFGISVSGRGSHVRNNHVLNTGGATSVRPTGIIVNAPAGVLSGNLVEGTTPAAGDIAYGIHATRSDGLAIEGNQVLSDALPGPTSTTFAIIIPFSQDVLVVNNRITRANYGVTYSSGATGSFRDNLTAGVVTPFTGGTDRGNNN